MDLLTPANAQVQRKIAGMLMILQNYGSVLETEAKNNAKWTDRTSNARNGLKGGVEVRGQGRFVLYLSHSVDYGVWLEKANSGNYAIIGPTIDANIDKIKNTVNRYWRN